MKTQLLTAAVIALSSYALSYGLAALLHGRTLRKGATS